MLNHANVIVINHATTACTNTAYKTIFTHVFKHYNPNTKRMNYYYEYFAQYINSGIKFLPHFCNQHLTAVRMLRTESYCQNRSKR